MTRPLSKMKIKERPWHWHWALALALALPSFIFSKMNERGKYTVYA